MEVRIDRVDVPYEFTTARGNTLFRIEEAHLAYEQFSGEMGPKVTRVNFERGDGVGVLPYIEETDDVVLVEQFRYPAFAGRIGTGRREGWLLEIVAGILDDEAEVVAERELGEETGLVLAAPLEKLGEFYLSPGGTSESMALFLARVKRPARPLATAGLDHEHEDIRVHVFRRKEALAMCRDGRIVDMKTVVALLRLGEN